MDNICFLFLVAFSASAFADPYSSVYGFNSNFQKPEFGMEKDDLDFIFRNILKKTTDPTSPSYRGETEMEIQPQVLQAVSQPQEIFNFRSQQPIFENIFDPSRQRSAMTPPPPPPPAPQKYQQFQDYDAEASSRNYLYNYQTQDQNEDGDEYIISVAVKSKNPFDSYEMKTNSRPVKLGDIQNALPNLVDSFLKKYNLKSSEKSWETYADLKYDSYGVPLSAKQLNPKVPQTRSLAFVPFNKFKRSPSYLTPYYY